jgi:nicotinate-nucleotide pyrophosphorylase
MAITKCPYCGSENLIIDYWTGTIICADCGSVIEENITEYAKLDVDVISLGYLTHSVKNFDVSLEIIGGL